MAPVPLSNQVCDLAHQLADAGKHSAIEGLRVVGRTEAFTAPAAPGLPPL